MIIRYAGGLGVSLLFLLMPALTRASQDCPRIVSNIERLACFDQAAGTPGFTPQRQWSAQELEAPTVRRVLIHETGRAPEDLMFRLRSEEGGLLISAPAIASVAPHPYLIISCVQNISRLQLVTAQPVDASRVQVQLRGERGARSVGL